jgi:hypothetical protein
VAAHDWRATLGHLSAIVTFLIGVPLSVLIARAFKAIMGIEVVLIVAASLVLA